MNSVTTPSAVSLSLPAEQEDLGAEDSQQSGYESAFPVQSVHSAEFGKPDRTVVFL